MLQENILGESWKWVVYNLDESVSFPSNTKL